MSEFAAICFLIASVPETMIPMALITLSAAVAMAAYTARVKFAGLWGAMAARRSSNWVGACRSYMDMRIPFRNVVCLDDAVITDLCQALRDR
ncbi:hypothetical protein ABT120_42415 [Nonomuraea angiospora]|uniref:hypothetical protein n=1 Tax=Nonomuraea angiospora TaxID=46172 RepID=UPI00331AA2B1